MRGIGRALTKGILLGALAMSAPLASHADVDQMITSAGSIYLPGVVVIEQGTPLDFVNADIAGHSVTSDAFKAPGERLFDSKVFSLGESGSIVGVDELAASVDGYGFHCKIHSWMTGLLIVVE